MRFAPLATAFALAAGLVGFSTLHGQPPAGKADKSPPAELAKFRGDWMVTKVELPVGAPPAPPEVLKGITASIADDRITLHLNLPGDRPHDDYWLLAVDPSKSPAHMTLTDATSKFEPRRTLPTALVKGKLGEPNPPLVLRGIYRHEANALVVAIAFDPELARPTEFKAAPPKSASARPGEPGCVVVHLAKKK